MLCVIWLDGKYCRWNCTAATLEPIRWIHLHRECLKTSFICYFIVTVKKLIWPVVLFIFLFMVTSRGTIFICSAGFIEHFSVTWKAYFNYSFLYIMKTVSSLWCSVLYCCHMITKIYLFEAKINWLVYWFLLGLCKLAGIGFIVFTSTCSGVNKIK